MDNSDVFGSSTAPFSLHDFLEWMRHSSAAEFVKDIKSFIVSFVNNARDPERDSAAVQEFLDNTEAAFRAHSLWAGSTEEELESLGEGLEKYVMTKLYTRVFASISKDVKADKQLHEKMALIQQFIRPENLDIKPTYQNETSWLLAQKELQKINMHKAPRDKLACILRCCKVINNLLLNASIASKEDNPGADEFFPVLIYVTIKANTPQLHSNLSYIQRYRRQTRLVSESAYYFTNMLSVESFIANIEAKALSMDDTEFEKNMEYAKALLTRSSDYLESQTSQSTEYVPNKLQVEPKPRNEELRYENDRFSLDNKIPPISDLENKGAAEVLKEEEEHASRLFRDFPYLYSRAEDLTVGDVEVLLSNYKQLVLKYVCLGKGLGVKTSPPSLSNTKTERLVQPEIVESSKPNDDMQDTSTVEVAKTEKLEQPDIVENSELNDDMPKDMSTVMNTKTTKLEQPEIIENLQRNDDMQKDTPKVLEDDSFIGLDNGKLKMEEVSVQNQVDEGDEKYRS